MLLSRSGFGAGDAALLGGSIVGGFIPGVGEAIDLGVLLAPGSTTGERAIAGASLAVNVFTLGLAPNFGGVARVAGRLDDLSLAGSAAARSVKGQRQGLTAAGHALAKHGGRGDFPLPRGTPADINRHGQFLLDDILTTPGSAINIRSHLRGDVLEVFTPGGSGARFDAGGFVTFVTR